MIEDLRRKIVEEFAVSQRIIRAGNELVPRFRISAPDGDHVALVQLPDDPAGRLKQLDVIKGFMIWKAATAFVLSSELFEPDALMVVKVTRGDVIAALQPIRRDPIRFGELQWMDRASVGDEIIDLLPPKSLLVTPEQLEFMRRAFEDGEIKGIRWEHPTRA
jgi:hypothetical protein